MSKAKKIMVVLLALCLLIPFGALSVSAASVNKISMVAVDYLRHIYFQVRKTDDNVVDYDSDILTVGTSPYYYSQTPTVSNVKNVRVYIPVTGGMNILSGEKVHIEIPTYLFAMGSSNSMEFYMESITLLDTSGNTFWIDNVAYSSRSASGGYYQVVTDVICDSVVDVNLNNLYALVIQYTINSGNSTSRYFRFAQTSNGYLSISKSNSTQDIIDNQNDNTNKITQNQNDNTNKITQNQNDNTNKITQNQNENTQDIIDNQKDNTQQIIDNQNDLYDNEKEETQTTGNDSIDSVTGAIPADTDGLISSFNRLLNPMLHTDTKCVITFPAINTPSIGGIIPSYQLTSSKTIDFEEVLSVIPSSIMNLVRAFLTIALIIFCFKELYSTISYVLTLKGGDSE